MSSPLAVVDDPSRPPGPVEEEVDLLFLPPPPAEVARLLGHEDLAVAIEALHSHPETRAAFIARAKAEQGGARG